tara:strand:- start:1605 stop:2192 length:588 start_codon:yes stop_codon:yes gene_type:complete
MSKKFALIGHRVPSHGKLNLNDLAGSCGRLDVLLRSLNSALFLSHGIRSDVEVILHLQGGEKPPRRIWIDGSKVRGIHSDDRSIAGHLSKILQSPLPPIGIKKEVQTGVFHGQGGLKETLEEWDNSEIDAFHLDLTGKKIDLIPKFKNNIGFVISDDKPFSDDEKNLLSRTKKISVGNQWIQGHSVISIIHYNMD